MLKTALVVFIVELALCGIGVGSSVLTITMGPAMLEQASAAPTSQSPGTAAAVERARKGIELITAHPFPYFANLAVGLAGSILGILGCRLPPKGRVFDLLISLSAAAALWLLIEKRWLIAVLGLAGAALAYFGDQRRRRADEDAESARNDPVDGD